MSVSIAAALWLAGLTIFIGDLPESTGQAPPQGDGVIVYTGGGGSRISAAMTLLSDGAGERLLISGVNPETSKERLADLWEGAPEVFSCCVDIGREALTTRGNADEAATWAAGHGFETVVLVTSDFHMPRAIAATRRRMPETTVTPFAVPSGYLDEAGRPNSPRAWRKVAGEYTKYLLASAASFFSPAAS